jgi:hypothetical protein
MKITIRSPRRLARDVPVAVQFAALLAFIPVGLLAATPFPGRGKPFWRWSNKTSIRAARGRDKQFLRVAQR